LDLAIVATDGKKTLKARGTLKAMGASGYINGSINGSINGDDISSRAFRR